MEFIPRFFDLPQGSCFLFGPRGTGKSTWLSRCLPTARFIDLLDPALTRRLLARPERLAEMVRSEANDQTIVIDEVQQVPELLSVVHSLMEEEPRRRFVLTGSSARKLRHTGTNLLGGRAVLRTMHPFTAAELGSLFKLPLALRQGTVPVVVAAHDPEDVLRAYASLYIREEVQAEGLTRNIGAFNRFLEAISFSHGAPLNLAGVSRDCQVERKTVESYVTILEDLLLSWRLPVFSRRAKRALTVHPKFYFFDAGVFRSLRPTGPLDSPHEIDGAALEGLVGQHLRAWIAYSNGECELFYWRTRSGSEVDFVIYGPGQFWAIEVRNSADVRPADLRALVTFGIDYPESQRLLLYRGTQRFVRKGVLCLPCEEFLPQLQPGSPIAVCPMRT